MQDHIKLRPDAPMAQVSTSHEFRVALERIRALGPSKPESPEGIERTALEIAVSRFLAAEDRRGER